MNAKKTLIEKYSIPIEHLDYGYIRDCRNVREMEQMIEILRSGEEGFYPDLTKFAENKLEELDPNNRILRTEVKCQPTGMDVRQEINEFVEIMKTRDRTIRYESNDTASSEHAFPPVRAACINQDPETTTKNKPQRITSSEYDKWDKFDADTECLKIDLADEQMREKAIMQQNQYQQKSKLIEMLPEKTDFEKMNEIEKKTFCDKHRIKGNEFFKCCDFEQAITEYTTSLKYEPTAAAYNNRALVHLKLNKYNECVQDCNECLKLDASNVKAMLRKCEALMATDQKNAAYDQYSKVLSIDAENVIAKKALKNISLRLEIEDVNAKNPDIRLPKTESQSGDESDDDLYRKLIIPKKIVPSRYARAMSNVRRMAEQKTITSNEQINF